MMSAEFSGDRQPTAPLPIPPHFQSDIFRNPHAPNETAYDVIEAFDPEVFSHHTDEFVVHAGRAYWQEKAANSGASTPEQADTRHGVDLRTLDGTEAMINHTVAHAVTGNLDAGTSNTTSIPYWDRQAAVVGLYQLYSNAEGFLERVQSMDAFSINVLRAHCTVLPRDMHRERTRAGLLTESLEKGQLSKQSGRDQQEVLLKAHQALAGHYEEVFVAKLKHLMWLVDVQPEATRKLLLPEVTAYVDTALHHFGTDPERLTIDMGADTGMSSATSRPPYEISVFRQLQHAGKVIDVEVTRNHVPVVERQHVYELRQEDCDRLSVGAMLQSIARQGDEQPSYEKDGKYHLPWRFSD